MTRVPLKVFKRGCLDEPAVFELLVEGGAVITFKPEVALGDIASAVVAPDAA